MTDRKQIRAEARARVDAEKTARRERREELKAMTPSDRAVARAADRTAAKQAKASAKAQRKAAKATMTRPERRATKRRERAYRRVAHRPRRLVVLGVVAVAVVGVGVAAAPYAGGLARLTAMTFTDDTPQALAAREAAVPVAGSVSDEGIVLLKNDGALPLDGEAVNVFSFASFNLQLGGGGSGGGANAAAQTLYEALEAQGVEYNEELYETMKDAGASHDAGPSNSFVQILSGVLGGRAEEPAPDYLSDEVLAQAADYSDTAIVVVGEVGAEASDLTADSLRLSDEQIALLDAVTERIPNVIVIVNSGNQMELGFLDDYPEITGAVWIGAPGPQGPVSLAKVLTGQVNPSGRLTDTYAYSVESAPATENLGNHSYDNVGRSFLDYEEGIYVGYRYYETRYDDDSYDDAVQYPFGHGLSYTNFAWDASEPVVDDEVSIDVTVTNTGDVPGKDVVQVYFSAPYTPGGIEKSAVELAGYAKTSLLDPGQSETVTVTFARRDMASWDTAAGAYRLEAGTYEIAVSTDVHTPVSTFPAEVVDDVVYDTDEVTGAELESRFDYVADDRTYLSREDWDATYPQAPADDVTASDALLARMQPEPEPMTQGEPPTYEVDNDLVLDDLAGLAYDDPKWDAFIDQLTLEEQAELFSYGAYRTAEVERLGVPAITLLDSPAGLNSLFSPIEAARYPSEIVIASTWNDDLAYAVGRAVAAEANAAGVDVWYAPGMNLHRSPMGGRDFEYFSEDPLISGKMGAAMTAGAEDNGVLTTVKHFLLNDQEVNARSGVNIFASEQALRELYLRPFEIAVKESGASGVMSSFGNIGGVWAGGNEQLLQEVLRGEWGFEGFVTTDAVVGDWMDPVQAVLNGNDLMLAALTPSIIAGTVEGAAKDDPLGVGHALRDRVHAVLFTVLKTQAND